jgi:hypothetical protein
LVYTPRKTPQYFLPLLLFPVLVVCVALLLVFFERSTCLNKRSSTTTITTATAHKAKMVFITSIGTHRWPKIIHTSP